MSCRLINILFSLATYTEIVCNITPPGYEKNIAQYAHTTYTCTCVYISLTTMTTWNAHIHLEPSTSKMAMHVVKITFQLNKYQIVIATLAVFQTASSVSNHLTKLPCEILNTTLCIITRSLWISVTFVTHDLLDDLWPLGSLVGLDHSNAQFPWLLQRLQNLPRRPGKLLPDSFGHCVCYWP